MLFWFRVSRHSFVEEIYSSTLTNMKYPRKASPKIRQETSFIPVFPLTGDPGWLPLGLPPREERLSPRGPFLKVLLIIYTAKFWRFTGGALLRTFCSNGTHDNSPLPRPLPLLGYLVTPPLSMACTGEVRVFSKKVAEVAHDLPAGIPCRASPSSPSPKKSPSSPSRDPFLQSADRGVFRTTCFVENLPFFPTFSFYVGARPQRRAV